MTKREPCFPEDDQRFLPVVPFLPFECPVCHSQKPITHSVRKVGGTRERYHRCQSCGQRYRSLEIQRSELRKWCDENEG